MSHISKIATIALADIAKIAGQAIADIAKFGGQAVEIVPEFSFAYVSDSYNKSDTDSVSVVIERSVGTGEASVTLTITGGKEANEDDGVGKNYTGDTDYTWTKNGYEDNSCVVTFADTVTTATVIIDIIDNPVFELDPATGTAQRVMTLTLSNPSIGMVSGGDRTITIVDDNANGTVHDAVTDVGLVANDMSEATSNKTKLMAYHQAMKNTVGWDATVDQAIIYFPAGTYYFEHDIRLWPGISHVGAGRELVTLARPNKDWYVANGFPVANGGYYYYPMFRWVATGAGEYIWSDSNDSKPCGFRKLSMDGAYDTFITEGPFSPYTLFEQSELVSMTAPSNAEVTGCISAILEDISFDNQLTTMFTFLDNTKSKAYHITNGNMVEGKGAYSIVGGNITTDYVDVVNLYSNQIDFEQNNGTGGHYGNGNLTISFDRVESEMVQLGLAVAEGTQEITFNTCAFGNLGITAPAADMLFADTTVNATAYGAVDKTTIARFKTLLFDTCKLTINPPDSGNAGIPLQMLDTTDDCVVEFKKCEFIKGSGIFPGSCWGISRKFGNSSRKDVTGPGLGIIKLTSCIFTGAFDTCYESYLGDKIIVSVADGETYSMIVNGAETVFYFNGRNLGDYILYATITGPISSDAPYYMKVGADYDGSSNLVEHVRGGGVTPTVILSKSNDEIRLTSTGSQYLNTWDTTIAGTSGRHIVGTGPAPLTGLRGDTYYDGSTTVTCTQSGYYRVPTLAYVNAVWA